MKTIAAYLACLAVLSLVLPSVKADPVPEAEAKQLFAWFDTLGFPDLAKCKCVRLAEVVPFRDEMPAPIQYSFAFLVKEEGSHFTVFTLFLQTQRVQKTGPRKPGIAKASYEEWNLEKALAEYIRQTEQDRDAAKRAWRTSGSYSTNYIQLFVWARAFAAAGNTKLSQELLEQVNEGRYAARTLRESLADRIGGRELERLSASFGDISVSRNELLERA